MKTFTHATHPVGVITIILCLWMPTMQAADVDGRYAIKGVGANQCTTYTKHRKNDANEVYMYLGWLQGWLSKHNQLAANTFDLASWQHSGTLLAALDHYCEQQPHHAIVIASEALLTAMQPERLTHQSLLVTAQTNGKSVRLYADV